MKIKVSLNGSSIQDTINRLNQRKKALKDECLEIAKRLAELGREYAEQGFGGALYDGDNDVKVHIEQTENGYKIVAKGQAVCFLEFGAGVYYNGTGRYEGIRPAGVVGIGEYGQGKGKRNAWGFYDNGGLVITHGNPPYSVMYRTAQQLRKELPKIAKEVFNKK
ncbi:MAG: hypothetical protein KBS62_03105 [Oscillospiraceae bacterium]|nr:hypothetical protein [Candidatus Ruminococcus equi]